MKVFECKIGDGFMCEDELPENLPSELYDWWFNNSHVDGVRVGPIIKTSAPLDQVDSADSPCCDSPGREKCQQCQETGVANPLNRG